MKRVNQYRFYDLAAKVHPLFEIRDKDKIKDVFWTLFHARQALIAAHGEQPLRISQPVLESLVSAIDAIVPRNDEGSPTQDSWKLLTDEETDINFFHGPNLRAAVVHFESVLSAELQSLDTYFIEQKGTHSTPDLIDHAENIFPKALRKDLPAQAIKDIKEAGKCLALDTPTAAGFHIIRALEAVMAKYYFLVIDEPMPKRMRNWANYIKVINKKLNEDEKKNTEITAFLDHIRENYRNPISHPEDMLTLDEAEVLLGVATSAIRQIILAIQDKGMAEV